MYNGEDPQTPLHFWSRFIPKHKLASTTDVVRRDVVRRDVVGVAEIRRENFSWQRFFPQVAVSSCSTAAEHIFQSVKQKPDEFKDLIKII